VVNVGVRSCVLRVSYVRHMSDACPGRGVATGMTSQAIGAPARRQTYLTIAGIAGVWILAALLRSETTFHLGPVILPLIPLLIAPKENRMKAVGVAVGLGAAVIAILSVTGNLSGPAVEPFPSALAESVLTLVGTGILALGFARVTR
jgi:hypothetical protein